MLISAYYVCVKNPGGLEIITVLGYNFESGNWEYIDYQTNKLSELQALRIILKDKQVISFGYSHKILKIHAIECKKFIDLKHEYRFIMDVPSDISFNRFEMLQKLDLKNIETGNGKGPYPGYMTCLT